MLGKEMVFRIPPVLGIEAGSFPVYDSDNGAVLHKYISRDDVLGHSIDELHDSFSPSWIYIASSEGLGDAFSESRFIFIRTAVELSTRKDLVVGCRLSCRQSR